MRGRRRVLAGVVAVFALLVSACGSSSSPAAAITKGGKVTIDNESGTLWTCTFNPFIAAANGNTLSFGPIYEPLVYDNLLTDKRTPMLATDYKWSSDNKTLTFTIRSGVKWSDGQPFSAADVVFTFNLLKSNSALDLQSVWAALSSVEASGTDKVVMTFQNSAAPLFYSVADETPIVPQHIWQNIQHPDTDNDATPVGTGPFTMSQCTPQNVKYTRNSSYWQPGLPYLDEVDYPAFTDNDPANQFLAAGNAQWGGQFIPNIDTYYVARDKAHNHYWFPPIQNVNLWFNTTRAPLDNKAVRQAIAYGIDRPNVSKKGEYGEEPPGSQTGVVTPTFDSWIDQSQASKYNYSFNVSKAQSILSGAGFTKGSDGIYADSSGKKLSFQIITVAGYTDWDADLQVIADDLKQVGIAVTVKDQSNGDYTNNLTTGNFDIGYGSVLTAPGPNPWYELRNTLDSATTADLGQTAAGDYGRYKNPALDTLFDQFAVTADVAKQKDLMKQIEAIVLQDVPVVPVIENVAWFQYSTKDLAGWPSKDDPYATPAPWSLPDWEQVLLRLHKNG